MTTIRLSELTGDYALDTAHTKIEFVARHTIGAKVRGRFGEFEGSAHLDGDDPSRSSARLTIQANSIDTRNRRRDDALSGKFLDANNHPTIIFTSTRVEQVDPANFKVAGDLTIRGRTKPVTMAFELTAATDTQARFRGYVTIDRKDWGVQWNAAAGLVAKAVRLEFEVAAVLIASRPDRSRTSLAP